MGRAGDDSADVVILGAGPAGLAAAYRLARAGRSAVVLERAPVPGGLAGSFDVAGVRVDHGSHRLHPSCDPTILGFLRDRLGSDLQLRPRHGRIRLADRWVGFPPRVVDLARHLPPRVVAGLALDTLTGPLRSARADTFAEVVRDGLGPTMLREFYAPYVEKIWGVPATALDGELARRRVGARSPSALLRKLVHRGQPAGAVFWSPRRGFGQISDALAEAAVAAGADVRFGVNVEHLRTDAEADTVTVHIEGGRTVSTGLVASTVPITALAQLCGDAAPEPVRAAAAALEFRALVLVYVVVARPRYTEFDAHYFPALDVTASRVSEPKNYRDGDEPSDVTVLCAELPCSVGDVTWSGDERELGARVVRDLAASGLDAVNPLDVVVRRVPRAYPVYRVGYARPFAVLDQWLATQARLVTFGRQGLFAHDNTHHAMAMGWALADCLGPGGELDRDRWHAAREGFLDHVVED